MEHVVAQFKQSGMGGVIVLVDGVPTVDASLLWRRSSADRCRPFRPSDHVLSRRPNPYFS